MKAKKNFILREIVDEYMIIPVNENIERFNGTVLVNDVAAFIWKKLQTPISRADLLKAVMDEYDVEEAEAAGDMDELLASFRAMDIIEDD